MQTNSRPLVSVVIPTYNYGRFLATAIQSVLEQTYAFYELIVIDDGSSDETEDVLQQFDSQLEYFYQENSGPSAARNLGIRRAKGSYICFLDADDLWTPKKLEIQLSAMESNPDIGLLFSDAENFSAEHVADESLFAEKALDPNMISQQPIPEAFSRLLLDNFITTSSVMVRRQCFEKVGLFNESFRSVEDRDMWLRISAFFGIACIPSILCRKRLHGHNISKNYELAVTCRLEVIESNRRLLPDMAPPGVWNRALADAYLKIAFSQFNRDQKLETLCAGVKSLSHAAMEKLRNEKPFSYPWIEAVGLLPAAVLGPRVFRLMRRNNRNLI